MQKIKKPHFMQFTKEEARQKLTEEFSKKTENIGSWERTINENVETLFSLLGENDSLTLEDFVSKALPLLETASGHIRKETSDLAKKYESKIKDLEKQKPEPKKNENEDPDIKKLLEKVSALENKQIEEEKQRAVAQKRKEISDKIREGGVKNDSWIDAILKKAAITEDTDVESEAKSYVEMFNQMSAVTPPAVTPRQARGKADDDVKEAVKQAAEYAKSQRLAD